MGLIMRKPPKSRQERGVVDDLIARQRIVTDEDLRRALEPSSSAQLALHALRTDADTLRLSERANADSTLPGAGRRAGWDRALSDERGREDRALQRERAAADEAGDLREDQLGLALRALMTSERDATDLRTVDERASTDARLATRDEFLAMVCHDLRSLLTGLALRATLLAREQGRQRPGESSLRDSDAIQRVVARMNLLIGDLIDVVAMETGRFMVEPRPCSAAAVLEEAERELAPSARARDLTLVVHAASGKLSAVLDVNRIQQVLLNLIGNALKFTPAGGRVEARVTRDAQQLRFEVSDTGPGIPADKRREIFERFTQVDPGRHVGLGLGLFICKNIVEAHRGHIWVEERPGGGSRFLFTVPALAPAEEPEPVS